MKTRGGVVAFDKIKEDDHAITGGKCASLSTMISAGFPVPPGFVVTTDVFSESQRRAGAENQLDTMVRDSGGGHDASAKIRQFVEHWEFTSEHERQIRNHYDELCEQSGTADVPVAVRSSATAEDSPDSSFAGEHDTYLWVSGIDAVLDKIRSCWGSLFTDRAIAYRERMGYSHSGVEMAVAVQKMVRPSAAGVAFTLDPTNGDKSTICIDSTWGFGEGVVSGEVTPDSFLVDKVTFAISRRKVSSKPKTYQLTDDLEGLGPVVKLVDTPADRVDAPSLNDDEVRAVAKLARKVEKHYGFPQDIEWAVDEESGEEAGVVLLQARPETVWSKPRNPHPDEPSTNTDSISSIANFLRSKS